MTIVKVYSMKPEAAELLDGMSDKRRVPKSKLIRIFIKYFSENGEVLDDLLKSGGI